MRVKENSTKLFHYSSMVFTNECTEEEKKNKQPANINATHPKYKTVIILGKTSLPTLLFFQYTTVNS